ncbi:MAG: YfcC family protein [Bacteroidota bacterium]
MRPKFRFPTPYTVLMLAIVITAIATWLLPAGVYDKMSYNQDSKMFEIETVDGKVSIPATVQELKDRGISIPLSKFEEGKINKPISIPGTYQQVTSKPQGIMSVIFAPIQGMYDTIDIILFVLIIGGFIGVFNSSGAFDQGIAYLSKRLKGKEGILIILVTFAVSIGGTTFGMQEETVAFYPLIVPIFMAAGYDLLVPVAVLFVGTTVGIMGGVINPFATVIASDAAGISWTIGIYSRVAMLVIGTSLGIAYILRYANKVKKDPTQSLLYGKRIKSPFSAVKSDEIDAKLTTKTQLLILLFAATFVVMIYGVSSLDWWFKEMTALFLVSAVIIALLQRTGERNFVATFFTGAKDLLGVSFIIGIARGITNLMNEGRISDTILFYATDLVEGTSGIVFLPALMIVFFVLTLFISSSSGLAVVSMPIMSALAPVVGVPTEEIINAYLFGFGLMTFITPAGLILPSLAMVNVDYSTWIKFIWPLMVILALLATAILWVGLYF